MLRNWRGVSHFMVLALLACGSEKAAEPSAPSDPEIIVSAPIPRASLPGGAGLSGSVVFVSAMPQAVPGAVQAVVQGADGQTATAGVDDGGFDPVALDAASGDAITVTLTYGNGATVSKDLAVRSRPPRVVRTSPAPHRTDVPLNAIIRVVFSTPMTLQSVREGVRLTQQGARVAAEVEVGDASGVAYDLILVEQLVPATEYAIEIAPAVEDVNGVPLGEAVTAPFTTTSSSTPAAVAHVTLANDFGTLDPEWEVPVGYDVALYARALAANFSPINAKITFSTEQPGLVQFSSPQQTGRTWTQTSIHGIGPGRATILARAGNAVASTSLVVFREVGLPTALAGAKVVWAEDYLVNGIVQGSEIFLVDADSRLQLTAPRPGLQHRSPMASVTGQIAFERAFMTGDTQDSVRIVIRNPDGWEQLVPTGGNQYCPSWSPDGSRLVFTESYRDPDDRLIPTLVVVNPLGMVQASWPAPSGQAEPCAGWTLDGRGIGLFGAPAPVVPPPLGPGFIPTRPDWYGVMTADSVRRFSTFVWNLDEGRWLSQGSGPGVELRDGKRSPDGRWVLVEFGASLWLWSPDRTLRAHFSSDRNRHSSFAY